MVTLSPELVQLGVRVGAQDLPPPLRRSTHTIEDVIDGRVVTSAYGSAYVVETIYPPTYQHGRTPLALRSRMDTLAAWARDSRLANIDPQQLLFVDTETSGLAGGAGTFAFLIGLGRFEAGAFRLIQLFMRDPAEESAVLGVLLDQLERSNTLVTFNGKAFDIPLLATRFTLNRVRTDIRSRAHVDLLPLARRLWRDRLESRALGFLEEHILGAQRAGIDVRGWDIPRIYVDYLRTGDARQLSGVFYHNAMDVVSMAGLLSHTAYLLENHRSIQFEHGTDLFAVGRLFEDLGRLDDATEAYSRALEFDLSENAFRRVRYRLSMSEKRQGHFESALALWREAADRNEIYACVELAKFYEHRLRNIAHASRWTDKALEILKTDSLQSESRRTWQAALERRLARLNSKSTML